MRSICPVLRRYSQGFGGPLRHPEVLRVAQVDRVQPPRHQQQTVLPNLDNAVVTMDDHGNIFIDVLSGKEG